MLKNRMLKSILLSLDLVFYNVFPTGTPYINTDTNYGNLTIYFNTSINNKLVYDNQLGYYVNVSSSTVYGYVVIDNVQYSVYFPTLDQPYYRESGYSSSQYKYFTEMSKGTVSNLLLYDKQSSDYRYVLSILCIIMFGSYCGFRLGR